MELTAVFAKVPEGYIAFIEELLGVHREINDYLALKICRDLEVPQL